MNGQRGRIRHPSGTEVFLEGVTKRKTLVRENGPFGQKPRETGALKRLCISCLPSHLLVSDYSGYWHCSRLHLPTLEHCFQPSTKALKTSGSPGISQAFTFRLGLQRHPATWNEQVPFSSIQVAVVGVANPNNACKSNKSP